MTAQPAQGALMAAEIAEQPDVFQGLLTAGAPAAQRLAKVVAERNPRFVLLAGRGDSDNAALYAKYLVEVSLGLPAGKAAPSTMTAYGARPDLSDVLLLTVGDAGDSPDLVQTVRTARSGGATTLTISNDPSSPVAAESELHLDAGAGVERVGPTKTYSAQLLALWLVIDAMRGGDGSEAERLPAAAKYLVTRGSEIAELAARFGRMDRFVTTARGYSFATAREAAAKLMETASLAAHAFSGADLLHGPLAMINQDNPVLAIVPDGLGADAMRPVLERLHERGADVTVFGGVASLALGTAAFDLRCQEISEELHPVIDIIPLQQLALELALRRGVDPDARN